MDLFAVSVVGGLSLGATYALVTLGLVLAFRATDVLNFSHGQFMLLAAYMIAVGQAETDLPFPILAIGAIVVTGLAGVFLYRTILRRLIGLPHFIPVIATLGFASIADGVLSLVFGTQYNVVDIPGLPTGFFDLFGARFSVEPIITAVIGYAIALAVAGVLFFSDLGLRVRAAGQAPLLAAQGGIKVNRIYYGSWAVAAGLAGIAGISYANSSLATPAMTEVALLAFPAMLLGGMDSIGGALIGGAIIGLLQGFVATYLGGEFVNVVTYMVLIAVMLLLPEGIFGTRKVSRV